MKKLIILPLVLLFLLSTATGCSSKEPDSWKDEYAAFLSEFPYFYGDNIDFRDNDSVIYSFSLRDLDNNGVPELLVFQNNSNGLNAVLTVYAFDGNVYEIGEYSNPKGSFVGGFRISDNPKFPGLFECWWGGGEDYYGYLPIKDGELIYESLWQNVLNTEPPQQIVLSNNKELIDESIRLYPPYESTDNLLEIYLINDENIGMFLAKDK